MLTDVWMAGIFKNIAQRIHVTALQREETDGLGDATDDNWRIPVFKKCAPHAY